MSELSVVEEYAIWLTESGVVDAASDDMKEGGDPISERGENVSDEDWRAAMVLAYRIAAWIRDNPEQLLALVAAPVAGSQETTGGDELGPGDMLPDGRIVVDADDDRFDEVAGSSSGATS